MASSVINISTIIVVLLAEVSSTTFPSKVVVYLIYWREISTGFTCVRRLLSLNFSKKTRIFLIIEAFAVGKFYSHLIRHRLGLYIYGSIIRTTMLVARYHVNPKSYLFHSIAFGLTSIGLNCYFIYEKRRVLTKRFKS